MTWINEKLGSEVELLDGSKVNPESLLKDKEFVGKRLSCCQ